MIQALGESFAGETTTTAMITTEINKKVGC